MLRSGFPSRLDPDPHRAKAAFFALFGYSIHHEEVARFHQSSAPLRIIDAPARTSKSYSSSHEGMALIMPTRPLTSTLTYLIGPDYGTLKEFDYYWDTLVENFASLGFGTLGKHIHNPANGNMVIELIWGRGEDGKVHRARIEGKSATNPRALQGDEVDVAIFSEACEQSSDIWEKYMAPRTTAAIFPSTPKPQAQWVKSMIDLSYADPTAGIEHFHFPPEANPRYDHDRFEREKKKALYRAKDKHGPRATAEDDPFFAEHFMGQWVFCTGKVLPFSEATHVIDVDVAELDRARFTISLDYGFRDPAVAHFWATLPGDIHVLFDEIYEEGLNTGAFCDAINAKLAQHGVTYNLIVGDPAKPEVDDLLRRDFGMPIWQGDRKALRDRAAGHRRLVDCLTPAQGEDSELARPHLFVSRTCRKTIHEWANLTWKDRVRDETSVTAVSGEDHAFDSARYFVMSRPREAPEARQPDWLAVHKRKVRMRGRRDTKLSLLGRAA